MVLSERDFRGHTGYGGFSPFARKNAAGDVSEVTINYKSSRKADFRNAKKALMETYGLSAKEAKELMKGQTWHHTENVWANADGSFQGTTILVDKTIHKAFRHTGGRELFKGWRTTGQITW